MLPTDDPSLQRALTIDGYTVLPPCVLHGRIGRGGTGAVHRARHLNLDIDVAVKCLDPRLVGGDEAFVARFRREARAAAQIDHPNVIRVFDVAEHQGVHYLIMELVEGETARERTAQQGRLAVGEALAIVRDTALGLAAAHRQGFVHRDVKPDNVLISAAGQVKVADLGLARPSSCAGAAALRSGANLFLGTPQYMAPEQWDGGEVTAAADVWSLGATLWFLLVGDEAIACDTLPRVLHRILREPFPDVRQRRPDVPGDVAALIARATRSEAADRYADAQAFADALASLATKPTAVRASAPGDAAPTAPPPPATLARIRTRLAGRTTAGARGGANTGRRPRRRAAAWLAGAALLLAAVAFAASGPWARRGGVFAEADRLEALRLHAAAIDETVAVHERDPSLPADLRTDRLARLHAAWARELAASADWSQALVQIERALAQRDTPAARAQKAELLQRIAQALDGKFVREHPGGAAVARGRALDFRGRLADPVVQALRIGERVVERRGGAFAEAIDPGDRTRLPVEVTLTNGEVLALQPWPIAYREAAALAWVRPPAIEGARSHRGQVVHAGTTLHLAGAVDAAAAVVRVDGEPVAAHWRGGEFRTAVTVAGPGRHVLRIAVQRADGAELEHELAVHVLDAPAVEFVAPTRDGDVTTAPTYAIALAVDRFATAVTARRDGVLLRAATPATAGTVRFEVPLVAGRNTLDVVVADAAGLETTRRLVVTRKVDAAVGEPPAAVRPRITAVHVAGAGARPRPVEPGQTVYVRSGARLEIEGSTGGAVVLLGDRALTDADLALGPQSPLVTAGPGSELRLRTAAGTSDGWPLALVLDDEPPVVAATAPVGRLGGAVPFRCRGTWSDRGGVDSLVVAGVAAEIAGGPERGTWSADLPGVARPTVLEIVATDRAGNVATASWSVAP